ncbi:hypothetical protein NSND_60913 [Nitrospira sp. ND1]|nr:hypothetical protein NSND_60913 [Nitrospira sp. ND1]
MVCWQPEPFSKVTGRIWLSYKLFRKVVRQGRSEGACEAYPCGTLNMRATRERRRRPFSTAC